MILYIHKTIDTGSWNSFIQAHVQPLFEGFVWSSKQVELTLKHDGHIVMGTSGMMCLKYLYLSGAGHFCMKTSFLFIFDKVSLST